MAMYKRHTCYSWHDRHCGYPFGPKTSITSPIDTSQYKRKDRVKKDISSIWSSLGRLRSGNTDIAKHPNSLAPLTAGTARRKVCRIVDRKNDDCSDKRSQRTVHREDRLSSPQPRNRESVTVNRAHNGLDESPKRVDFSSTHQLREVNWDGTYQDTLACPVDTGGSILNINSFISDKRERDLPLLDLTHTLTSTSNCFPLTGPFSNSNSHSSTSPPFAPPPSVSNSTSNFHLISPPSSRSTSPPSLSSSSSITNIAEQDPDVRWARQVRDSLKLLQSNSGNPPAKAGVGKSGKVKLTRVDLQTANSTRAGHSAVGTNEQSLARPKQKGLSHVRKQVEERWQSPYKVLNKPPGRVLAQAQGRLKPIEPKGVAAKMDNNGGGESVRGAEGSSLDSPRLPIPFKMSITADLKEDKIMLRLKEKLKQQRALANSSVSENTDSSLIDYSSGSSAPPPALPARTSLSKDPNLGLEKPRKVAASHHSLNYRGFSEASPEHVPWRPSSKMAGIKKNGGFKKQLPLQPKKHDIDTRNAVLQPSPEKPKKITRLVSAGNKKASKSGVTNIITTSSWRAGQELIMKELGLIAKPKGKTVGQNENDSHKTDTVATERIDEHYSQQSGEADCHASGDGRDKDCGLDGVVGATRVLSRDSKSMLSEVKQVNLEDSNLKVPTRPAVKRKAPKATDPDKHHQPSEKTRHYDQDAVRKFMAKQKAERWKRLHDEKIANQKADERKQQILHDLTERQKQAARAGTASAAGRSGEGERKRKSDGRNKENVELNKQDQDDNSTLTEGTGDSTPQATFRGTEEGTIRQRKKSKENEVGLNTNQHAFNVTTTTTATVTMTTASEARGNGSRLIEFSGQKLNLDVESILNRFSQVVKQKQIQPGLTSTTSTSKLGLSEVQLQGSNVFAGTRNPDDSEIAFTLGTTNSMARTNEERKQAIKATALTLQSRLAEERRKMEEMKMRNQNQYSPNTDFLTRYNRIAGNSNDFTVFSTDLPGSRAYVGGSSSHDRQNQAAMCIQAAYRGHSVRQALNWELPSGQTFGQRLKGIKDSRSKFEDDDGASELTETSTFSEVTATEESDVSISRNVGRENRHQREAEATKHGKPTVATYKPSSPYTWTEPRPDPYSVMSVFCRQNRYLAAGSRHADMPFPSTTSVITTATSAAKTAHIASMDLTSMKEPMIITTEHVVHGHTPSGQPIIAKTRYTRVEAVVSEKAGSGMQGDGWNNVISDDSVSASESSVMLPSKHSRLVDTVFSRPESGLDQLGRWPNEKSEGTEKTYTYSFESDDDRVSPYSQDNASKDLLASGYKRGTSNVQETYTSQKSEEESRSSRSKAQVRSAMGSKAEAWTKEKPNVTAATADSHHQSELTGRLSPNSLANKFSANLNYLESMEESLRQVIGMERVRSVALAQQETVSLAQILKARQQERNIDMQNLQFKAQQEAEDATQELGHLKTRLRRRSPSAVSSLLENEDNHRPESKLYTTSLSGRSVSHVVEKKDDLAYSPGNRRIKRSTDTTASTPRTSRDQSSTRVKTAEDSRNDIDSSIRTASDAAADDESKADSIPEDIPEDDSYSLSFDESVTEVLPSESHRKELRRWSGEFRSSSPHGGNSDYSSHITPYGDLSSLFSGENSFNRFTADMVRQIMREEEYRAQHQAALLSLREKALKEKAKTELAWLQQLKQKPHNKAADDVYPNLEKREKKIKKNLQKQQTEIRRLQEANKIASKERQMLLKQHEKIARIKQNTQETLHKLLEASPRKGKIRGSSDVHTEDEIEESSDMNEEIKDSKSDSEVYRDKPPGKQPKGVIRKIEKQQKLRLDEKYMTAREHKLHERQKQAKELLEWKKRLDAEEERVFKLEKRAIEAWEEKSKKNKEEVVGKKTLKPVSASKKDDSHVVSDRMLSSMHDELDRPAAEDRSHIVQASISEAISASKTEIPVERTSRSSVDVKEERVLPSERKDTSPGASGSESSIPEEILSVAAGDKQALDSSDDTLINSSANDDYVDTFEPNGSSTLISRKKSPVGKLLLQGSSPLPTPWSRKTGSESESEDSVSHTETTSDVSDYEVRIRQLSDELRRRRKEIEILKKERSRRQKEKLKAQEEAMQKQLDAYNNYIQQLRQEKEELEHVPHLGTVVKPQIKQPKVGNHAKPKETKHAEDASSSFEDMRDGIDSNQTSPSVDGKDISKSQLDGKDRRKVSLTQMSRLSEGSEPQSEKSGASLKTKSKKVDSSSEKTNSASVDEVIEVLSQVETDASEKTASSGLKIQTSFPTVPEKVLNTLSDFVRDEDSYSMDFSSVQPSLAHGHSSIQSARSEDRSDKSHEISEYIEEQFSVKTQSATSPPKLHIEPKTQEDQKDAMLMVATTGIQESDSETESRVNSYHTSVKSEGSSRPSSERSLGSFSYSPGDDDEEDIISFGSDKTPLRPNRTASARTEENISEHISTSLPSISEKQQSQMVPLCPASQEMLDSLLDSKPDDQNEEDTDKTPVPTPREMVSSPVHDDVNTSLISTDPLADFSLGDRVCVMGHKRGVLRFKGKVDFSPGIWAGVELDAEEGDSDGLYEGKRYFTCSAGHGLMVHGSDILVAGEQMIVDVSQRSEAKSPDESIVTDQDDSNIEDVTDEDKTVNLAPDTSMFHSTPVSSPHLQRLIIEKPQATPVKKDITIVADNITDHLTASLVEDSVKTIGQIASKKTPPPTLPKPAVQTSYSPLSQTVTDLPNLTSPKTVASQERLPTQSATDKTTDGVMKSLLEEAITDILKVKRRKEASSNEQKDVTGLINGDFVDQGAKPHLDISENGDRQILVNGSGLFCLEPVQRPGSPVPDDHKKLNDDMADLFGGYIDDDLHEPSTVSGKPPPPYPDDPFSRLDQTEEITPVVPSSKEEVAHIVTRAVEIYWESRRYGEPLEGVTVPPDFLSDAENEKNLDHLTAQSRRSWKRMVFDLTGEIITDIYKTEDKDEVPVWQKTKHKTQKFYKGSNPPTTIEGLKPVVHAAVFKLLGLNGTRKFNTVNKWNIRKKKDAVDAILVQELGEEELGWVDYNDDELNLKMSLVESLFDSLILDTVHTLNEVYRKKQHSQM